MGNWIMYVLLVILICLSAFFSTSETAFSTVNKIRLRNRAENGNRRAKNALDIAEHYDQALSTILIGNNIVNIASSSIATVLAVDLFGPSGAAISTAVMTVLILIFGEVLPKSLAKENSESFALTVANIMHVLMIITYPLVLLFILLKKLAKKISSSPGDTSPSVTEEELKYIVESIEEEGVLEEQESELVQHALEFDEKTAQAVLTPRVDMLSIDINDDLETNREIILRERFSRIPVYEDNVDDIIGILHTRDFLEALGENKPSDIRAMLQPAFFIYKTKKLSSLLNDFRRKKIHVALVTDDYGGILGMVTMEDLLEQLVGEIWDEDEEVEQELVALPDGSYEVQGDLNTLDLFDRIDFDARRFDSEYNSVSGWALEMLEHIPEVGESFTYRNLKVTVTEMDDQRITKLHVQFLPEEEPSSEGEQTGK